MAPLRAQPIRGDDPVQPSFECIDRLAAFLTGELMPGEGHDAGSASTAVIGHQPPPSKRLKSMTEAPPTFVTPKARGGGGGRGRPWLKRNNW
jgi:hypothetical protein